VREHVTLFEGNPDILSVRRFSDEVHFHFDGYINKQNARSWGLIESKVYCC
jgi:hypothetical protein